jgi:hypothetical protein
VVEHWRTVTSMKDTVGEAKYPMLSCIAAAALSLPHANAAVERVFSQLVDLVTKKRNR